MEVGAEIITKECEADINEILGITLPKYEFPNSAEFLSKEKNPTFLTYKFACYFMEQQRFITFSDTDEIYYYKDGVYTIGGETVIKKQTQEVMKGYATLKNIMEILNYVRNATYIERATIKPEIDMICVKNGVLNVTTGVTIPLTPDRIFFNRIPITYNLQADCPQIKKFISEVAAEKDVPAIQEFFGYCLYKDYPVAIVFMLIGGGGNGKTTLINLLNRFVGYENISSVALQNLESGRFSLHLLHNKLVNNMSDITAKDLTTASNIKALTGRDMVMGEAKYQKPFFFQNYAKLIYSCNALPPTRDTSDGFFRRQMLLEFNKKFEGANDNKFILDQICTDDEMSGLLNWAIQGLHRLLKTGEFSNKRNIEDTRQIYQKISNSALYFIDMVLEGDSAAETSKKVLMDTYLDFCKEMKLFPMIDVHFFRALKSRIYDIYETRPDINGARIRMVRGVRIKEKHEILMYKKVLDFEPLCPDSPDKKNNVVICKNNDSIVTMRNNLDNTDETKKIEIVSELLAKESFHDKRLKTAKFYGIEPWEFDEIERKMFRPDKIEKNEFSRTETTFKPESGNKTVFCPDKN